MNIRIDTLMPGKNDAQFMPHVSVLGHRAHKPKE